MKHTRESIKTALISLAGNLNTKKLSKHDITSNLGSSFYSSMRYHFGSPKDALKASGLENVEIGANLPEIWRKQTIDDKDLFKDLLMVEKELGREPNASQYNANGKYSIRPFRDRFGKWPNIISFYRKWKNENLISNSESKTEVSPIKSNIDYGHQTEAKKLNKRPSRIYGELIDFRGIRHAPTNELGVVFLFGMVSKELGFLVEAMGADFPDCEGKYLYDPKKNHWSSVKVEFKFKASNFKEHNHNPDECDIIVCWKNDWPGCPVDVIELKSEILKLPSK